MKIFIRPETTLDTEFPTREGFILRPSDLDGSLITVGDWIDPRGHWVLVVPPGQPFAHIRREDLLLFYDKDQPGPELQKAFDQKPKGLREEKP